MTRVAERAVSEPGASGTLEHLRRYGEHSSGFLTLNDAMEHYTAPGVEGFIAYRPAGRRHLIQLCGPVAPAVDRAPLLLSFLRWAAGERRRVTAVQLTKPDALLYAERGFTVNQLGASYSIDLTRFSLGGTRFMKVRNKVKRARRCGISIREWTWSEQQDPTRQGGLAQIDRTWLHSKGAMAKELAFMVGERGGHAAQSRRLFVATDGERPVAYATYSPCFGSRPGWLYDLTRRRPDAPAGTIELLFLTVLERLLDEGCRWLHLGFTPMTQLEEQYDLSYGSSALVRWALRLVGQHGELIYPARSQEQFKLKWAPHAIEPEYIGFAPRVNASAVWQLLRLTRAI
ncbi:MAG TPA: DUF2156 domain-containing protein [Conexibacter sp.]|nr:DUF2156 domain-containing protein [Conexibacter sp.]